MKRKLIYLVTILVGLILIVNLVRTIYQTYRSGQRVATLAREVEGLRVQEDQLKEKLAYRQSEEFVEQEARDKLNLVKPGETVVVFDESEELGTKSRDLGEGSQKSNYQEWKRLFLE